MKILPKKDENEFEIYNEIEIYFDNHICEGKFYEKEKSFILNFSTSESVSNLTYRIIDQDSISVCLVEISSNNQSIQYHKILFYKLLMFLY